MNKITPIVNQILAIAEKDLRLESRFIIPFLSHLFFSPLKTAVWFLVVYYGFFTAGSAGVGSFNSGNYFLFVMIGSLFQLLFTIALTDFPSKFFYEKFWQTIQGFLVAPINSMKLVLGLGFSQLVMASFAILVLILIAFFISPIPFINLVIIVSILIMLFLGLMFIGLIRAGLVLVSENLNGVFDYFVLGWGFISCFYYPIESFPRFIRPIIFYNPIYQAVTLVRNLWENQPVSSLSLVYVLSLSLVAILLGAFLFKYLIKNYEIEGY